MTKICKKSLALLLALAVCVSAMVCGVVVSAETPTPTITLVADKAAPVPGDTVQITAQVANFSAVFGADVEITLPAGLAVTEDKTVAIGADDEIYYNAEKNTLTYVGVGSGLEMADGVVTAYNPVGVNADGKLFAFTFVVPQDATPDTKYAFEFSATDPQYKSVRYCDANETEIVPTTTGITVVVGSKVVKPVLDENISLTRYVAINTSLGVSYFVKNAELAAYDHYEVVVNPTVYDANYNETAGTETVLSAFTAAGKTQKYATYTGIAMIGLGLKIEAYVKCYDAKGNFVAHSATVVDTPAALLKTIYGTGSNAKLAAIVTDMLNMGAEAQRYFGGLKSGSDLNKATLVNDGWVESTTTLDALNTVNETKREDPSFTNTFMASVGLGNAPAVAYLIQDTTSSLDLSKLTMEVSYDSLYPTAATISATVNGEDWTRAGKWISYSFNDTYLFDGNKTVTATIYYDGVKVITNTYSVESYINANQSSASTGNLLVAIAKFGKSARAYFGTN